MSWNFHAVTPHSYQFPDVVQARNHMTRKQEQEPTVYPRGEQMQTYS